MESLDNYTKTDPKLVVDGCYAIVSSFVANFDDFDRPGYCENLDMSVDTIVKYAVDDIPRNLVSSNDLDKLANIIIEWQNVGSSYGIFDGYDEEFDMKKAANLIRNGRDSEEEEEYKKPAVAVAVPSAAAIVQAPISKKLNGSPDTAATEASM